jgi:hypothetical protein
MALLTTSSIKGFNTKPIKEQRKLIKEYFTMYHKQLLEALLEA